MNLIQYPCCVVIDGKQNLVNVFGRNSQDALENAEYIYPSADEITVYNGKDTVSNNEYEKQIVDSLFGKAR